MQDLVSQLRTDLTGHIDRTNQMLAALTLIGDPYTQIDGDNYLGTNSPLAKLEYHLYTLGRITPRIVTLVGSTRFCESQYQDADGLTPWERANLDETMAGNVVLTVGISKKSDLGLKLTDEDKHNLNRLHLKKIDLADDILVINVEGYIGDATKREIEYAITLGKDVLWRYPELHTSFCQAIIGDPITTCNMPATRACDLCERPLCITHAHPISPKLFTEAEWHDQRLCWECAGK